MPHVPSAQMVCASSTDGPVGHASGSSTAVSEDPAQAKARSDEHDIVERRAKVLLEFWRNHEFGKMLLQLNAMFKFAELASNESMQVKTVRSIDEYDEKRRSEIRDHSSSTRKQHIIQLIILQLTLYDWMVLGSASVLFFDFASIFLSVQDARRLLCADVAFLSVVEVVAQQHSCNLRGQRPYASSEISVAGVLGFFSLVLEHSPEEPLGDLSKWPGIGAAIEWVLASPGVSDTPVSAVFLHIELAATLLTRGRRFRTFATWIKSSQVPKQIRDLAVGICTADLSVCDKINAREMFQGLLHFCICENLVSEFAADNRFVLACEQLHGRFCYEHDARAYYARAHDETAVLHDLLVKYARFTSVQTSRKHMKAQRQLFELNPPPIRSARDQPGSRIDRSYCTWCGEFFNETETEPLVKAKECGECHLARHCSRACQSSHWKRHKPLCRAFVAERRKAKGPDAVDHIRSRPQAELQRVLRDASPHSALRLRERLALARREAGMGYNNDGGYDDDDDDTFGLSDLASNVSDAARS